MTTLLGRISRPAPAPRRQRATRLHRLLNPPPPQDPRPPRTTPPDRRATARAWAELLRISALPTVPGDTLTGAAALALRPNRRTALALGTSLCLYTAGMALNDWADRAEDARERPTRPIPSGRITPTAALTAAVALTATGLALATRAGRPALTTATALAATVWAYDLRLKHTPAGPTAMAAARALDLLLGAAATLPPTPPAGPRPQNHTRTPRLRTALPSALALAAHTHGVTTVSRHETHGGSTRAPLAALATTLAIAAHTTRTPPTTDTPGRLLRAALTTGYLHTAATPLLHAALNPSPPLTRRAVGNGIRALVPLQAALATRGATPTGTATALALLGLAPAARALARTVSPT
ncbi:SCO3242 family prenyltransferase [Streptomyces yaizuensis]|uniref:UbiA family prenyltransferase n=1 Tax=Streptomyces yaizuensis TaxID=2989713 RepID=A0ABQ5P6W9_9ACTN|nr:UbiA family prenyltransferase [Streptomyces sp. YSPA8]GLF98329.1 UbiA family prenyltransferase [Streptomyces sp. YSPA8]